MRRKGLLKSALAITLSAAMTMGSMSTMAFASEEAEIEWGGGVSQSTEVTASEDALETVVASETTDVLQETADQEETQTQEEAPQEQDEDVIIQVETDALTEDAVVIDNNADDLELDMGDANVAVIADETEATSEASTPTQEEKDAAAEYLNKNYIDGDAKAITANATKSEDGLTYTIGLETSSGGAVNNFRLKYEYNTQYLTGWYIEKNDYLAEKDPATNGKIAINKRPDTPFSFTATLKLFAVGTDTATINADTAEALATQDFTFILAAKEAEYTMTVQVQDQNGTSITDATVTIEPYYYVDSTPSKNDTGDYILKKDTKYTLTVKKDGYNDFKEDFTFAPSNTNTVKTVTLTKIENKTITFHVTDQSGNSIEGAKVTVKKGYYDTVTPTAENKYSLVKGQTYKYTVQATNYTAVYNVDFTVSDEEVITVKLTKNISEYTITFKAQNTDGKHISGASVNVTYEEEDDWGDTETTSVVQNTDGSFTLNKNTEYTYIVKVEGYKTVTSTYTPSGDDEVITVPVTMEKDAVDVTECMVTIQAVDSESKAIIEHPTVKVIYYTYNDYYGTFSDEKELSPDDDGIYTMTKSVEYTYTVSADGYKTQTGTYEPDGTKATDTLTVSLVKVPEDTEDQRTVDAIKAKFDGEYGALCPNYATDTNILDVVKTKINGYTDIDTTGVTVSLKSSDATDCVANDGTIHYIKQALEQYGNNSKNVDLVFVFGKNDAKAETKSRRAIIGWDRNYFNQQMETDKMNLTWDTIKGSNADAAEVTSDLTLPQCMGNSAKQAWSKITWQSSDETVISFENTAYDTLVDPKKGVIHPQTDDREVTLTATFKANEFVLSTNVEQVSDFATLTKEFKVTVKGNGVKPPTKEELQAILDKYYTADKITEFNDKTKTADLNNCTTDLQLIRYTQLEDENRKQVFEKQEITVTSDNDALKVDAYHAYVDRFTSDKDVTANLIVTFTRQGVSVEKKIPVTVKAITEADLKDELDMMAQAKEHYFDGINDSKNESKMAVTENMHAFKEMILDENGSPKWIYDVKYATGSGIIPDDFFTNYTEMETNGYNKFKSSKPAVVTHENLLVTRDTKDTYVTISSLLTSETYKTQAEAHPENALLQKLYKQKVSVTIKVKGTDTDKNNLTNEIATAKTLLDSIVEGTDGGQYPVGTKEKLQNAITAAETVLNAESSTEADMAQATETLATVVTEVADAQLECVATVEARMGAEANKDLDVATMTVTASTGAKYGYTKDDKLKKQVTAMDVLVAWHATKYGEAFEKNPENYLKIGSSGWIGKVFGITTDYIGIMVNNEIPGSAMVNQATVQTGDSVTVFIYGDEYCGDVLLYFTDIQKSLREGETLSLTLYGKGVWGYPANAVQEGYTVAVLDAEGNQVATAVTGADGKASMKLEKGGTYKITITEIPSTSTAPAYIYPTEYVTVEHDWDEGVVTKEPTCAEDGVRTYTCSVCEETKTEAIQATGQHTMVTVVDQEATCGKAGSEHQECSVCHGDKSAETVIPATGEHTWGAWKVTKAATALAKGVQTRSCNVCGEKQTQEIAKLSPKMTLSASSVSLKLKQSTTALKVTGMATGDYLKSVTVKDSSYATVTNINKNGTFKLTAKNKAGSTTLTITLASGLKKTATVKVQKKAVTTTKITGLQSKVTVKKGAKLILKPVVTPITSAQKCTYTSSNKKVATVSSKGVITAKATGTAKITVKSGSKKVVVTVTVPKTKTTAITVKTAVTVKKGKTIALGAKKTPANSDEKITYVSANKKIATVTSAGKIKGIKKGTTTITVKSGSVTKKIKVTVK